MLDIDKYAFLSRLSKVNPVEKIIFSIVTLTICIFFNSVPANIAVFAAMAYMVIFKGGLNARKYIGLLFVPASFLMISIVAIAIDITHAAFVPQKMNDMVWKLFINNIAVIITYEGIQKAVKLFFTAIASVSCLYFLILTTHITEIIMILRKIKVPEIIIDIMTITYRFICVMLETASCIIFSQTSRLGYTNAGNTYRSLAGIVSSLFSGVLKKADQIYMAMESRCGWGCVNVLVEPGDKISAVNIIKIIIFEFFIISFSVLTGGKYSA